MSDQAPPTVSFGGKIVFRARRRVPGDGPAEQARDRGALPCGHGPHPYRSPPAGESHEPIRPWIRTVASTALVLFALALGIGFWGWMEGAQARAVAALPAAERARLFERTLKDLRLCHAEAHEALREFCDRQAKLALAFPECSADCRALTRLPWARATR